LNFPKNGIRSQIRIRNHDTSSNPCLSITSVLATMAGQPAWQKQFRFPKVFTQVGSRVEAVGSAPARKSRTEFMLLFHTHIPGHKKVHIILQAPFEGLVPKYWILFRGLYIRYNQHLLYRLRINSVFCRSTSVFILFFYLIVPELFKTASTKGLISSDNFTKSP
jgi:hypothetical protein